MDILLIKTNKQLILCKKKMSIENKYYFLEDKSCERREQRELYHNNGFRENIISPFSYLRFLIV